MFATNIRIILISQVKYLISCSVTVNKAKTDLGTVVDPYLVLIIQYLVT